ncbi:hypothetical protein EHO60_02065 [Leptospira fletcheri]|uniref:Uncharacterized protein n=1 Tax=Leptospira fletcheri TaxID=2484981 RepID=A0A4V3JDZ8_9LEPT|nr:hypothetical protein [Leptospira fletcheri]TGK13010.1 hypothetical protein EHO60_02065 [Leptospira fletcheri]
MYRSRPSFANFSIIFLLLSLPILAEDGEGKKSRNAIFAGFSGIEPVLSTSLSYERFTLEKLSVGLSANFVRSDDESHQNEIFGCILPDSNCKIDNKSKKLGGLLFLRFYPFSGSFFLSLGAGNTPNLKQDMHLNQDFNLDSPSSSTSSSVTMLEYKRTNVNFGLITVGWRWSFWEKFFVQAEVGAIKEFSGHRSVSVHYDSRISAPGASIASLNTLLFEVAYAQSNISRPGGSFLNFSAGVKF